MFRIYKRPKYCALCSFTIFIIPSEEHVKIYFHDVRAKEFQAMSHSVTSLIFLVL